MGDSIAISMRALATRAVVSRAFARSHARALHLPPTTAVHQHLQDGVLTLTLDREERMNALSMTMASDILEITQALKTEDHTVRALILTGRGKAFCTGRDLKESKSHTPEYATRYMQ